MRSLDNLLSTMTPDFWSRCCERLAAEMPEQQFNTWIRPLAAPQLSETAPNPGNALVARMEVPNRFKLDWIRSQYGRLLDTVLSDTAAQPVRLELVLAPQRHAGAATGNGMPSREPISVGRVLRHTLMPAGGVGEDHDDEGAGSGASPATHAGPGGPRRPAAPSAATVSPASAGSPHSGFASGAANPHAIGANRLNPALTFDTLVAGRANQMGRTAALHVAGAPGHMYNPLFIYGGVGLGKTHLIHAVGNALLKDKPHARILYLHAEQFISDVVKNYQRKTFDELKAKYHQLDLLLIDDVQFFAGKERTQEEFFNAFEALLAKKAHIIMTSDTYPKGLVDIDQRLTSRFDAGLTVAIEPPELEMRVAILIRKAESEGTPLPEDVAFFVAKNVRANVRELEGALRKVLAYARFTHKDITINLAREALKDLLSLQNRQISIENIQKTVADFYKIKVADMYSKKRPNSIARPRQIAMYLAKEMTQKSLPEIGDSFGGRDHTTVLHAVRKIGGERQKDSELNQQLHVLEQTLKG